MNRIDLDGKEDISIRVKKAVKTLAAMVRHPIVAGNIGLPGNNGGFPSVSNISTKASSFSVNLGLINHLRNGQDTQVNAFRHTMWQALIAQKYGANIARGFGNAHEANHELRLPDPNMTFSLENADEIIDLLNNLIGQRLGGANTDIDEVSLANLILYYYHNIGLWQAEEKDGSFIIKQIKLPENQYLRSKKMLQKLNNKGLTPEARKAILEKTNKQLEEGMKHLEQPNIDYIYETFTLYRNSISTIVNNCLH